MLFIYRRQIRGPILTKDLNALSDQVYNVAKQLTDRRSARTFEDIASTMRVMMSRSVAPLVKLQGELVDRLTALELHLQPLQRQVNQSISHLKTIQYYIDNQGAKIAQLARVDVSQNMIFAKWNYNFGIFTEIQKVRRTAERLSGSVASARALRDGNGGGQMSTLVGYPARSQITSVPTHIRTDGRFLVRHPRLRRGYDVRHSHRPYPGLGLQKRIVWKAFGTSAIKRVS